MAEMALLHSDNDNDSNDKMTRVKITRFMLLLSNTDITDDDMLV